MHTLLEKRAIDPLPTLPYIMSYYVVIPWALESWADYDIQLFTDLNNIEAIANHEHAIVTMNHPGDIDWMVGWTVIEKTGMLGVRHTHTHTITSYCILICT